jgi:hypothetical protein
VFKLNSVYPWLESTSFQPLNQKWDILLSKLAFKFSSYRYAASTEDGQLATLSSLSSSSLGGIGGGGGDSKAGGCTR